ncbi:bifunctional (p)ppGpp synthetase/guanosine-3',5'-bis(diphosphate) 3'-pyrophosphohydrolase [Parasphingopyxis sp. CP4]|uniref:HD domain-containing protein n=1 Tax=Parasphingopyxis sp. CP4 TaxID=2724527 RepID=UPI00159FA6CE|nr:HD domain-containing protein [Parasphingopyxis sp. CP4]QLC22327.1 bifunctional (p)ppGpp synthetase/guanosine-3',5'-bis(diphosphate) 3'-pyrophosphohydrolase [Parasphingopyxis sp. CP4]
MTEYPNSPALLLEAARFSAERHRNQRRKDADATPYINHPLSVAALLAEHGVVDGEVLAAALLHDTVEDTETSFEELEIKFGARVTAIVAEVTDDKALPKAERKRLQVAHAPHKSPDARLVKIADKTSNLTDIVHSAPGWPLERKQDYFDWAKDVVDLMRGINAELEAAFDAIYAKRPTE